jgi:hypothetical protein
MKTLAAGCAVALALCVYALPANAQASRTFVSGVGNDLNPCSRTAPCANFFGALSKTAAGGEIDCLDSGGFGTVTIDRSLTIDCTGVGGSILAVGGTSAITVNAGPNDRVVLRNLTEMGTTFWPGEPSAADNDEGAKWCVDDFTTSTGIGVFGTPGEANPACP